MGGLGRDSYRTMFSLDDRSLQEGGAAILESKGDLGAAVFRQCGARRCQRTLASVSEEALQFHRKRARNTQLAELKHQLAELKASVTRSIPTPRALQAWFLRKDRRKKPMRRCWRNLAQAAHGMSG